MSRLPPALLVAGLALALLGRSAQAQSPLQVGPVVPGYQPVVYDGYELIPPGVYGGPAFGYSGHGYYYDGPGEGPLPSHSESRRVRKYRR